MTPAQKILDEIEALWSVTKKGYRNGMVYIGRKLHEYVLARLREGDHLNEEERRRIYSSHASAVQDAASRLQITPNRITDYIHAAMGVDLLSDKGEMGELSFASIKALRLLVERVRGKVARGRAEPSRTGRPRLCPQNEIPPSMREKWRIRPGLEQKAIELFRSCVADNPTSSEVLERVRKLVPKKSNKENNKKPDKNHGTANLLYIAKNAHPRDLAEMILSLIRNSRQPDAVTELVEKELLQTVLR